MTGSDTRSLARFLVDECHRTSRDWDRHFEVLARDASAHVALTDRAAERLAK